MIKKRPSHGKIVILTEVYFLQITKTFVDVFGLQKWRAFNGTGALDDSRNLGGTLYITGLVHQNVSSVYGILQPSFDRG